MNKQLLNLFFGFSLSILKSILVMFAYNNLVSDFYGLGKVNFLQVYVVLLLFKFARLNIASMPIKVGDNSEEKDHEENKKMIHFFITLILGFIFTYLLTFLK